MRIFGLMRLSSRLKITLSISLSMNLMPGNQDAITIFDTFDVCFSLHIWIQIEMKIKGCQLVQTLNIDFS